MAAFRRPGSQKSRFNRRLFIPQEREQFSVTYLTYIRNILSAHREDGPVIHPAEIAETVLGIPLFIDRDERRVFQVIHKTGAGHFPVSLLHGPHSSEFCIRIRRIFDVRNFIFREDIGEQFFLITVYSFDIRTCLIS